MDINHQTVDYIESFTKEQCDKIINYCENIGFTPNRDYSHEETGIHHDKRPRNLVQNNIVNLVGDDVQWIYDRMIHILNDCNQHFQFDITEMRGISIVRYDIGDHYKKHHDLLMEMEGSRKLSISIQLSEPEDYDGGELVLYTGEIPIYSPTLKGSGIMYVATIVHEVLPVTRGHRYSLVAHYSGPKWW